MLTKPCYLLLPVITCALACSDAPTAIEDDLLPYEYVVPPETGDGWTTASLADVGLAEDRFVQLIDIIRTGTYANIHGIVVVKDHRLVFEEYFDGLAFRAAVGTRVVGNWKHFDRAQPHNLASATKSITSTILGIAIDKGFVSSVDTAVYDFFPEYSQFRDARKDSITLQHMLTMTSGLDWDESTCTYGQICNDINALFSQADPVRYILAKAAVDPPGERWLYNGGGTNVLGQVVRKASGQTLEEFANEHLFGPLGISPPIWIHLAGPMTYASGDLKLRPRDMAKIGYIFANDGQWNGQQIISPEWIAESTQHRKQTWDPRWGYGYQWWLFDYPANGRTYRSFGARGWGGQIITVFPDLDMVVVLTGGNYLTPDPTDAVIRQFVLDALIP
ncbi:MAG: serine hydrolase [Gemmatimonadetes bacterium]|nr:serine hydrolase [Gemmatimonadota bacterium]